MTNTRANMSNKYWENETPIVTETEFGGVSYFKTAGKVQIYPMYEKDGELRRGKGCTWDNNNMEADDAVRLVYAIMQGLIDVGVESDAFSEAYSLLGDEIGSGNSYNEDIDDEDELDEDFEDETPDYSSMKLAELKEICIERGIQFSKRATKEILVKLLETDDSYHVYDKKNAKFGFVGKNISYLNGKFSKSKKTAKNAYIEYGEESAEWVNYILESKVELEAMPTKTSAQKKKQNKKYEEVKNDIAEWIETWGDDAIMSDIKKITDKLLLGDMDADDAICKISAIIDIMKL